MQKLISRHVPPTDRILDLAEHPETLAFCQVSSNACGYQNNKYGVQSSDYISYPDKEINLHNGDNQEQRKKFKKHDRGFSIK